MTSLNALKYVLFTLLLSVLSCQQNNSKNTIQGKRIEINDSIKANAQLEAFIKPYKERVNSSLDSIISYAPKTYTKKDGELNTAIGNLMAEAVYEEANPIFKKRTGNSIDFALLNYGGIRSIISKGTVTLRTAYEVMPFENALVVVALKGSVLNNMMTYLTRAKRAHPISKQLQIILNEDYSLKSALLNKKPIQDNKIYYVATSDYLYHGGDNMKFFGSNTGVTILDYKIRNVLIDYFQKKDTLNPQKDNRFIRLKK